MNGDTPSRPRLVFDQPFRVVGYIGQPTAETGILLWSGIDPQRYFKQGDRPEHKSLRHLLTLDYAGQVVAWQSRRLDDREPQWLEVLPDSIEKLNQRIRTTQPLQYRQPPAPISPT